MIKLNEIMNLEPGNPELDSFVNDTLIPGIFEYLTRNKRACLFIPYINSLGISSEFVSHISRSNKSLKQAINIALEICFLRLSIMYPVRKSKGIIDFMKSLFFHEEGENIPDSLVIFAPAGMPKEEIDEEVRKYKEKKLLNN